MQNRTKSNTNSINDENNNDEIDLVEVYEKYTSYKNWFLFGISIALLIAFFYIRYTPNQYLVNASILIDDKDNGGELNSELTAFKDLGLLGDSKTSLETEIDVLKSRTLLQRMVKELGINVK